MNIQIEGQPIKIVFKNSEKLMFLIEEKTSGVLILSAYRENCPLYYHLDFDVNYRLNILVKGVKGRKEIDIHDKRQFTNILKVLEVVKTIKHNNRSSWVLNS